MIPFANYAGAAELPFQARRGALEDTVAVTDCNIGAMANYLVM